MIYEGIHNVDISCYLLIYPDYLVFPYFMLIFQIFHHVGFMH